MQPWIQEHLPSLQQIGFLLPHWQWIGLMGLILGGVVVDRLVASLLAPTMAGWLLARKLDLGKEARARLLRPAGMLAMAALWGAGLPWLDLPESFDQALHAGVKVFAALTALWAAGRTVDALASYFQTKATRTLTKFDDLLIPMIRRALKIFLAVIGGLFIAENFSIDIKTLLAGLGLGGLAFALAAKDTVENLFGSITVLLDRPFQIGDRIVFDGLDGYIEALGFRSTRLRTLDDILVTIPNARLMGAMIQNLTRRRFRLIDCMISIAYDTHPEKIEAFCEGIRELIRMHPKTRKNEFYVHFNVFGAASLDIQLYCFIETLDWGEQLRERERLFLDILRLAATLGVEFAYPTQTLFLRQGSATVPKVAVPSDLGGAVRLGREEARKLAEGQAKAGGA